MFNSVYIDIGIGLAVVFFLVAALVAALNQAVTRLLDVRAKILWRALANVLDAGRGDPFEIRLSDALGMGRWWKRDLQPIVGGRTSKLSTSVANTAIVKTLGGWTNKGHHTKVDTIPTQLFSRALLEVARTGGNLQQNNLVRSIETALASAETAQPDERVVIRHLSEAASEADRLSITLPTGVQVADQAWAAVPPHGTVIDLTERHALLEYAVMTNAGLSISLDELRKKTIGDNLDELVALTEGTPVGEIIATAAATATNGVNDVIDAVNDWYDGLMDRVSSIYRIAARKVLFIAGMVLAIGLNVDAIGLAQDLRTDSQTRSVLAGAATVCDTTSTSDDAVAFNECAEAIVDELQQSGARVTLPVVGTYQAPWAALGIHGKFPGVVGVLQVILGWLVTGLAVSFGAPFWFDVAQRLSSFRRSSSI